MNINRRLGRARNTLAISPTRQSDVPLVVLWEKNELHVTHWSAEQHLKATSDTSIIHHMIFVKRSNVPVGYAVLKRNSPEETSVEFLRLVICDEFKSRGYGSLYFEHIWDLVFSEPGVERIWHDVFVDNHYAVHLYEKLGYARLKEAADQVSGRALFFYELTRQSYFARMAK